MARTHRLKDAYEPPMFDESGRQTVEYQVERPDYVLFSHQVDLIRYQVESGDTRFYMFPSESYERIAFEDDYSNYMTGARNKVVNSPKWRSQGQTSEQRAELMGRRDQLRQNLGAAHINADQHLRRKIVQSVREFDIDKLFDTQSSPQGLPARLRVAKKDGVFAPHVFANEVRSNQIFKEQLRELASLLDDRDGEQTAFTAVFESALNANQDGPEDSDAARFIYAMGEFWTARAVRMHEVWQAALGRYNQQFPDNQIDPNDPRYALAGKN